jgi:hypothetical protein
MLRQFDKKIISARVQQTNLIAVFFDMSAKRAIFVVVRSNSDIVHQLQNISGTLLSLFFSELFFFSDILFQ